MHRKHKYDIVVILSLVGFGISIYLAVTHYLGIVVPCDITHGCEAVLTSKYSSLLGLPLSIWGVAFFTGVIGSALLANHYQTWKIILTVLLSLGGAAALIFLILQFFVLKKICQYCLVTDLLSVLLLLWDLNIEHRRFPESPKGE